jgi:hypothetical protein
MIIETSDGSWFYMTINADIVALAEREYLPGALAGNSTAAKYLLWVLAGASEEGIPLSPNLGKYLAKGLLSISRHEDAEEAFHIKRGKGEKDMEWTVSRSINCVAHIKQLVHAGMGTTEAIEEAAEKFNAATKTVWNMWRDYRDIVELHANGKDYMWHKKNDK